MQGSTEAYTLAFASCCLVVRSDSDSTSKGKTEMHRLYIPIAGAPVVDDTPPSAHACS